MTGPFPCSCIFLFILFALKPSFAKKAGLQLASLFLLSFKMQKEEMKKSY
ncbi:hypothetical protein SD77_0209 [Bacillus badius]|uniref:Ribose 5-phosphate isomerase B n=1 Tax=Bacillus badius TaxID=1455 RepID=A0ABR5B056_BACBA|nr:hypothetical protein SD78_3541 [Bacillus badius]KIL80361.1 hypothetical protein SD77_0209 [Bacillus badius]